MTGPDDSHSSTRPISVAELLARNGTIGAPPVGGRRRRRRGNTDSVTVAELTGEIPIVAAPDVDEKPETAVQSAVVGDEPVDVTDSVATNGVVHHDDEVETDDKVEAVGEVETGDEGEAVDEVETGGEVEAVDEVDAVDEVEAGDEDVDDDYADAVADYAAYLERRETDPDLDFFEPPRRSHYAPRRFNKAPVGSDAEQMSPDPLDDEEDLLNSSVEVD